jgi:hypothetical protein
VTTQSRDYTLSLRPEMSDVGLGFYDIANAYKWSKLSVFYDDDDGIYISLID